MKSLKIKEVKAYNFLAFGEEGIEIKFENLGKIVLIKGKNLDYLKNAKNSNIKDRDSSNGSGKSSIQEIICYGIYGKTIKSPKKISKDDVINNFSKKNCRVEVYFDDYKISRARNPDHLRLWKSKDGKWTKENEITQGKQQDTQEKIESIFGINYEVFISTCVFSDDQSNSFLESDLADKRSIIENLLSLDVYRSRFDHSKELVRESKSSLKQLSSEYEILDNNKSSLVKRLDSAKDSEDNWKKSKKIEVVKIIESIKSKKEKLGSLNEDESQKDYEKSKSRLLEINKSIDIVTKEIDDLQNSLKIINDKKQTQVSKLNEKIDEIKELKRTITDNEKIVRDNTAEIDSFKKKNKGKKCEHCLSEINPDNFLDIIKKYEQQNSQSQSEIDITNKKIEKIDLSNLKNTIDKLNKEIKKHEDEIAEKNNFYKSIREEHKKLSAIKEPDTNTQKSVIEKEIEVLKSKAKEIKAECEGESPYKKVINDIEKDISEASALIDKKKDLIKTIEKDIPYLEFWVNGFGDSGIRKSIVDGRIPMLNKNLQYFMTVLDNGGLKIEFDNELKECIQKNIDGENFKFKYYTLSAGQRRRLNLAINQSFAQIMTDSTGSCPNVLFLDEVSTNIDPVGVFGIYNLICELSEDRQVFVTTHDPDLLDMLSGCDVLSLELKNGISTLVPEKSVEKNKN